MSSISFSVIQNARSVWSPWVLSSRLAKTCCEYSSGGSCGCMRSGDCSVVDDVGGVSQLDDDGPCDGGEPAAWRILSGMSMWSCSVSTKSDSGGMNDLLITSLSTFTGSLFIVDIASRDALSVN